jgi:uncharacterized protein (DUF4415 family)
MTTKSELRARARASLEAMGDEEDARIRAGIAQDPDNPEITQQEMARMRVHPEMAPAIRDAVRHRGAQKAPTKELVSLRLDPDVLEYFRATGSGWQSRVNAALRKAAGL